MGSLRQRHIGTGASGKSSNPGTDVHKPAMFRRADWFSTQLFKQTPVQRQRGTA
jgi:hypothetical protein